MLTTLRPEMLSGVLPRLVSVTVFRELLPTSCAPKLRTSPRGSPPSPCRLRLTVCGLRCVVGERKARRPVPVAEGVNVTLTAQVPLGVTVAPVQVSALLAKSLAFVPADRDRRDGKVTVPCW